MANQESCFCAFIKTPALRYKDLLYPSGLQKGHGSSMIHDGRVELIFSDNLILVTFSQGRAFCLYEDEIVVYEEDQLY